jgi:outer membrane receptor protein involved in Fe transport
MYSDRKSESRSRDTVELSLTERHTKNLVIAPTVEVAIGSDWKLSVGGNWGRDQYLGTISYASTAADPFQPYTKDSIENESYAADVNAEGPLFQLPGGAARLAVGGGFRHVSLRERNLLSAQILEQGVQRNGFAYAELGLPFVSPGLGIAGIKLFSLTAALRAEEYNSFMRVVTPKVGFVYSPGAGLILKGSWGQSFKAPTLLQQNQSALLYAFPTAAFPSGANYPADAQLLLEFGGNPNLKPERSQSLTFTFDYQPTFAPGLDVSLTYFHIDYRNRVVQPLPDFSNALDNPIFAPYIVYAPTSDQVANSFAGAQFIDVTGGFDGSKVVAILQDRYTNAARQKASGIDAVINYTHAVAGGTATFSSSGSYLNLSQQTGVGQPTNDISGKAFYPATFNGRAGLTFDKNGFSTSVFVNYTSSVSLRDLVLTRPQRRSGDFTTVDLNARYNTGVRHGSLANIEIAVAVQNLFNRAPPIYAQGGSLTAPYDSTNYSAVGRVISLSLAKHF